MLNVLCHKVRLATIPPYIIKPKYLSSLRQYSSVNEPFPNAYSPESIDNIEEEFSRINNLFEKPRIQRDSKKWFLREKESVFNYIDMCTQIGKVDHALSFLMIRSNLPRYEQLEADYFNVLMLNLAEQGDYKKLSTVLSEMQKQRVPPNVFTHIAVLGCLSKLGSPAESKVRQYIEEVSAKGFDLNELYTCIYIDHLDLAESAKALLRPFGFHGAKRTHVLYENPLLEHLNDIKTFKNNFAGCFTGDQIEDNISDQLDAERLSFRRIKLIGRHETAKQQPYRMMYENLKREWRRKLKETLEKRTFESLAATINTSIAPYVAFFTPDEAAAFMVEDIEEILTNYSNGVNNVRASGYAFIVGNRYFHRHCYRRKHNTRMVNKIVSTYRRFVTEFNNLPEIPFNLRKYWCQLLGYDEELPIVNFYRPWSLETLFMVGNFYMRLMVEHVTINKNIIAKTERSKNISIPAFYLFNISNDYKIITELKAHPVLNNLFREVNLNSTLLDSSNLPMKTPPLPWQTIDSGPFLFVPSNLIRSPMMMFTGTFLRKHPVNMYVGVLDSISYLQLTPWSINRRVFEVMSHFFNICFNVYVKSILERMKMKVSLEDEMIRYSFIKNPTAETMPEIAMRNLRCKLSVANDLIDTPFFFPLFLDFRGRSYPMAPYLNHTGDDMARGLLQFAVGKPLGPSGLRWLKIQLANLTGLIKRASNDERVEFIDDHMDDILDSADNPIDGKRWWLKNEKSYQILAICIDIACAIRSEDPEKYITYVPIHQDGSFNGLQHYAALGRDSVAAKSVNLIPHDHPKDAYLDVVELVESYRQRDEVAGSVLAASLKGMITRKVVKQTVMTTVYGVTKFGAEMQVLKKLQEFPDIKDVMPSAIYVTKGIFDALGNIFNSTTEIQLWLKYNAFLISKLRDSPIEWISPLGLPIKQPYFKNDKFRRVEPMVVNSVKQRSAFPPNFIHSLDASHMLMTTLNCKIYGMPFAAVHDCYWAHPSDIDRMNRLCREEFVRLHKFPILENLSEQFDLIIKSLAIKESFLKFTSIQSIEFPKKGDLDLNQIIESEYFFS